MASFVHGLRMTPCCATCTWCLCLIWIASIKWQVNLHQLRSTDLKGQSDRYLVGSTSKLNICHSAPVITPLSNGSNNFCKYVAPYTWKKEFPCYTEGNSQLNLIRIICLCEWSFDFSACQEKSRGTLKQNVIILLARLLPRNNVCMESANSTSLENIFHRSWYNRCLESKRDTKTRASSSCKDQTPD